MRFRDYDITKNIQQRRSTKSVQPTNPPQQNTAGESFDNVVLTTINEFRCASGTAIPSPLAAVLFVMLLDNMSKNNNETTHKKNKDIVLNV